MNRFAGVLATLLMFVLLAQLPAASSANPVRPSGVDGGPGYPDTGTWFGSTVNAEHYGITDHQEALLYYQDLIGRKLAVQRLYYAWDEPFPTDYEYWLADNGQYALLSWGARRLDGTVVMWRSIASGAQDAMIDARAADLEAFGFPVYLIFDHEPEDGASGSSADFISAFQHIRDRFVADGVTNVSYIMALMAYTFRVGGADAWYPGDAYVDAVAADGYNFYQCPGHDEAWMSFEDIFAATRDFAETHNKPMVVAEYGSAEDPLVPGRKGQWFTDVVATAVSWPELKMVSYYNGGPPGNLCPWFVDTSTSSLNGFRAMGADPYMNPPPPLVSIDSAPLALSRSTSATFTFSTNTPGSVFGCKLDAGHISACTSPETYTGLAQGLHTFTVFNRDSQGNIGQALDTWTVDSVAPTVTIVIGPDDPSLLRTGLFRFSASEDDVTFTCQLDSRTPSTCVSGVTYLNLSLGLHTFTVYATDPTGNVGNPATWLWTIIL